MRLSILPVLLLFLLSNCSGVESEPKSDTDPRNYPFTSDSTFGEPALFAPGSISTRDYELNNVFSPDLRTIYYTKSTPNFNLMTLVKSEWINGGWSDPEVLSFSGRYVDVDPALTPDGSRMFYISKRPNPGKVENDYDIYVVDRNEDGWGTSMRLEAPVNTDRDEYYPAVSGNGTLYLSTVRDQGLGSYDLYRSYPNADGTYSELENLGAAVNSKSAEIDVYVDPDEEYIIFVSYKSEGFGSGDLYVSFNRNGEWTEAQNLGEPVNSPAREYTPMVSPDGRFLFYTSERGFADETPDAPLSAGELQDRLRQPGNGLGDVYFIERSALEPFKK